MKKKFIYKFGGFDGHIISSQSGKAIAVVFGDREQSKSDGVLMASAPELLSILSEIVEHWKHNEPKSYESAVSKKAQKAIRTATKYK